MQIQEIIVRTLSEYRHQNEITLRKLSSELGYSETYISRVESQRKPPSAQFLCDSVLYLVNENKKNNG